MTESDIRKCLDTNLFGKIIHCFDVLDSTNTYTKKLALQGAEEGTVVLAEEQISGRGRFERKWISSGGKNLTFSVIVRPNISPQRIGILSLYAALAVTKGILELLEQPPTCKWPNDVLLNGKKVCGILSEAVFIDSSLSAVIIGIGLNVNQTTFPPAIESSAISLAQVSGHDIDRSYVLACVLGKLEELYRNIQEGRLRLIIDLWQQHSTLLGKKITVDQQGNLLRGTAKAIDDDGGLILAVNGGERKVHAGDVTIVS